MVEIKGFSLDDEKWDELRASWINIEKEKGHISTVFHCPKHNTIFNYEEEPCWQCWDSCQKEV